MWSSNLESNKSIYCWVLLISPSRMQPSIIKEYLKTWNEFELDKQIKCWNFCANTIKKNLEGGKYIDGLTI